MPQDLLHTLLVDYLLAYPVILVIYYTWLTLFKKPVAEQEPPCMEEVQISNCPLIGPIEAAHEEEVETRGRDTSVPEIVISEPTDRFDEDLVLTMKRASPWYNARLSTGGLTVPKPQPNPRPSRSSRHGQSQGKASRVTSS